MGVGGGRGGAINGNLVRMSGLRVILRKPKESLGWVKGMHQWASSDKVTTEEF